MIVRSFFPCVCNDSFFWLRTDLYGEKRPERERESERGRREEERVVEGTTTTKNAKPASRWKAKSKAKWKAICDYNFKDHTIIGVGTQ